LDLGAQFCWLLVCVLNENDEMVMMLRTDDELRAGVFIKHVQTKKEFLESLTGKNDYQHTADYSDDELVGPGTLCTVTCRTRLGIGVCVCHQFPIATIHEESQSIFEGAATCFDDEDRLADCIYDFPPSKKRWCMCLWYSINVFQVRGCCN